MEGGKSLLAFSLESPFLEGMEDLALYFDFLLSTYTGFQKI
jgi:hypothetical protein